MFVVMVILRTRFTQADRGHILHYGCIDSDKKESRPRLWNMKYKEISIKGQFRIKDIWGKIIGKTWGMHKNINKDKKSIDNFRRQAITWTSTSLL